jgi:hypothetical protein
MSNQDLSQFNQDQLMSIVRYLKNDCSQNNDEAINEINQELERRDKPSVPRPVNACQQSVLSHSGGKNVSSKERENRPLNEDLLRGAARKVLKLMKNDLPGQPDEFYEGIIRKSCPELEGVEFL